MSDSTPAALNASPRYLRSAVSHRADEAASGKITPTLAFDAGVLVAAPPLLPLLLLDESSLPQAATLNARAALTATAPRARNCIWVLPFLRLHTDGDYLRIRSIPGEMTGCQAILAISPRLNTSATAPNTSARSPRSP